MANEPSRAFGRYKLIRMLGEGGMGQVWQAVMAGPMGFEKECALKMLRPGLTEGDRLVKGFINEARLGGYLSHPNIVEIFEFNREESRFYLAMEYVDGPSLEEVLQQARSTEEEISPRAALDAIIQACRGLHHAHTAKDRDGNELKLVHRDVKPGNMMIRSNGVLKLMDFGVARSDANLFKTTDNTGTKGTPVYMSPEQVRAERDLTPASDIWAVGAILYELVTGKVMFRAPSVLAVMHRVLGGPTEGQISEADERIPGLSDVIRKCLAIDAAKRYETAAELGEELERLRIELGDDHPSLVDAIAPILAAREQRLNSLKVASLNTLESMGTPYPDSDTGPNTLSSLGSGEGSALRTRGPSESRPPEELVAGLDPELASLRTFDDDPTMGDAGPEPLRTVDAGPNRATGGARETYPGTTTTGNALSSPSRGLLALVAMVLLTVIAVVFLITRPPGTGEQPTPKNAVVDPVPDPAPTPKPDPVVAPDPVPTPKPEPKPTPRPLKIVEKPDPKPTPKTVIEKPTPKPPPPSDGTGILNLNSRPWSEVSIDGKLVGKTPVVDKEVPAGNRTVTFNCTFLDPPQTKTITVYVPPDGEVTKRVTFE